VTMSFASALRNDTRILPDDDEEEPPMDQDALYKTAYLQRRCPECGGEVQDRDKDTSSGREIHFLKCSTCSWSAFVDVGIALWKALSQGSRDQR
jgi:hypothetical protein